MGCAWPTDRAFEGKVWAEPTRYHRMEWAEKPARPQTSRYRCLCHRRNGSAALTTPGDSERQSWEHVRNRLVDDMPQPWPTYRDHVKRAVSRIWVSHKPDHSYERAMHNDTAYGLLPDGKVRVHKLVDGRRKEVIDKLKVIPFSSAKAGIRHGFLPDGSPRPYKGYKGDSNYCIEIVRDCSSGNWRGSVVSTYEAYQVIREYGREAGWAALRNARRSLQRQSLVMRLMIDDVVRLEHEGLERTMRVVNISSNGQMFFADIHESNVDARNRSKDDPFKYISKTARSLRSSKGRRITVTPAGRLLDPGFVS